MGGSDRGNRTCRICRRRDCFLLADEYGWYNRALGVRIHGIVGLFGVST